MSSRLRLSPGEVALQAREQQPWEALGRAATTFTFFHRRPPPHRVASLPLPPALPCPALPQDPDPLPTFRQFLIPIPILSHSSILSTHSFIHTLYTHIHTAHLPPFARNPDLHTAHCTHFPLLYHHLVPSEPASLVFSSVPVPVPRPQIQDKRLDIFSNHRTKGSSISRVPLRSTCRECLDPILCSTIPDTIDVLKGFHLYPSRTNQTKITPLSPRLNPS